MMIESLPDYIRDNSIELIVVALAFTFSRSKVLPGFLILYIVIMTITLGENQRWLDRLFDMRPYWSTYNKQVALAYLFESAVMAMMGVIAIFNVSRLAAVTTLVVANQSMISAFVAFYFYAYSVEFLPYIPQVLELHYFSQTCFVIIYCVIAWMCVYYSRKG